MTDSKMPGVNLGAVAMWTELREAMIADGLALPERLGPNATRVMREASAAILPHPAPVEDAELEAMIGDVETFINEPPRRYDIEPMDVRDYRHSLYPMWSKLITALRARTAQPVGVTVRELEDIVRVVSKATNALRNVTSCGGGHLWGEIGDDVDQALRALISDPIETRKVTVKALEWDSNEARDIYGDMYQIEESADGTYEIEHSRLFNSFYRFPTIEAAKAAAQADYEQRILSALLPEGGA